ncbi:infB, partial [Symbiodinium sp. CCMP2456]
MAALVCDCRIRQGVTGKGSALASLDDDELVKVKAFLNKDSGGKSSSQSSPSRPTADEPIRPERPVQPAKPNKIRTLGGPLGNKMRSKDEDSPDQEDATPDEGVIAAEEQAAPVE